MEIGSKNIIIERKKIKRVCFREKKRGLKILNYLEIKIRNRCACEREIGGGEVNKEGRE